MLCFLQRIADVVLAKITDHGAFQGWNLDFSGGDSYSNRALVRDFDESPSFIVEKIPQKVMIFGF